MSTTSSGTSAKSIQELQEKIEALEQENASLKQQLNRGKLLFNLFESAFREYSAMFWAKDAQGKYLFANKTFLRFINRSAEEVIGKTDRDFLDKNRALEVENEDEAVYSNNTLLIRDRCFDDSAGNTLWYSAHKIGVLDADGNKVGLVGYAEDITEKKKFYDEIEHSRGRFETVLNSIREIVFQTDSSGRWTYLNPSWSETLGYTVEESLGVYFLNYVHEEDKERNKEYFVVLQQREKDFCRQEVRYIAKDGSIVWIDVYARLLFDGNGEVIGTTGTLNDITQRKEYETALKEQETLLRGLLDAIPDLVFLKDSNFTYRLMNKAFCEVIGHKSKDLIGKTDYEVFAWGLAEDYIKKDETVLSTGKSISFVDTFQHNNGVTNVYDTIKSPLKDADGKIIGIIGICRDISQLMTTEAKLEQVLAHERTLLDVIPYRTWIKDLTGAYISVNGQYARACKLDPQQMVGKKDEDLFSSSIVRRNRTQDLEVINSGRAKSIEEPLSDGKSLQWFETFRAPIYDRGGTMIGLAYLSRDITERREAEEELNRIIEEQRALLSSINSYVYFKDRTLYYLTANQSFCDLLQVSPAEINGKTDYDLFNQDFANSTRKQDLAILETGVPVFDFEEMIRGADGRDRWVITTKVPYRNQQGQIIGMAGSSLDITARKLAENALARKDKILSTVAASVSSLLESLEFETVIPNILGKIGIVVEAGRCYIFQNSHDKVNNQLLSSQVFEWCAEGIEPQIDNPDLQNIPFNDLFPRWVELLSRKEPVVGLVKDFPEFERSILEPQSIQSLLVLPVSVNNSLWGFIGFDEVNTPREWSKEEIAILSLVAGAIGAAIEQQEAYKSLEQAMISSERANNAKSEFLANMSHELRTPLNGILGYAQILMRRSDVSEDLKKDIGIIERSGNYLLMLINDILDLSKIEAGKILLDESEFDPDAIFSSVLDLMKSKAEIKKLKLHFVTEGALPESLIGDEKKIRQIIMNLVGNAVKFTHEGSITVTAGYISDTELFRVVVEDTGIGISSEVREKVFESFFQARTANASEGTGLGLAISKKLALTMGGDITVDSQEGSGSKFALTLKLKVGTQKRTIIKRSKKEVAGYEGERKRILYADDNEFNRLLIREYLGRLGFEFIEAKNGVEAITKTLEEKPDLILMDLIMPELDGHEASYNIKKKHGVNTPIIALSASVTSEERIKSQISGCDAFLSKPVVLDELLNTLARFLNLVWIDSKESIKNDVVQKPTTPVSLSVTDCDRIADWATRGDFYSIQSFIKRVEYTDGRMKQFATIMRDHLDNFRFEEIIDLVKSMKEQQ